VAHGLALASWASRLLGLNEQAEALGKESLENPGTLVPLKASSMIPKHKTEVGHVV